MSVRSDFVVFILTHNRPDRVLTYGELRRSGYTGPIRLVIDDEDPARDAYLASFGAEVVTFSRSTVAKTVDGGDNTGTRGVVYARNACFALAVQLGFRYFVQLDDDYTSFFYRWASAGIYGQWRVRKTMDDCMMALLDFFETSPRSMLSVAMSQGGDHIGGGGGNRDIRTTRKAMNSFFCSTDRPFRFMGRINEDVNAYVLHSRTGHVFLTIESIQLNQLMTQSNPGGLTELYLDAGTYVKSFYSVMCAPSSVRIAELSDPRSPHRRIHHVIDWSRTAPRILREEHRQPLRDDATR